MCKSQRGAQAWHLQRAACTVDCSAGFLPFEKYSLTLVLHLSVDLENTIRVWREHNGYVSSASRQYARQGAATASICYLQCLDTWILPVVFIAAPPESPIVDLPGYLGSEGEVNPPKSVVHALACEDVLLSILAALIMWRASPQDSQSRAFFCPALGAVAWVLTATWPVIIACESSLYFAVATSHVPGVARSCAMHLRSVAEFEWTEEVLMLLISSVDRSTAAMRRGARSAEM